jgi:hypothetical protein
MPATKGCLTKNNAYRRSHHDHDFFVLNVADLGPLGLTLMH